MKALILISLLLGLTPSTPLQDPVPLAKKEPPTFHPAFMGLFHGDKLPGFDMLNADGTTTPASSLAGQRTILALCPPNLLDQPDSALKIRLAALHKRYADYGVRVVSIVNWMSPEEFRAAAAKQAAAIPWPVYGDPIEPFKGDPNDAQARIRHGKTTLLGKLSGGGMTPALPGCILIDSETKLVGSFFLMQSDEQVQEGLGNLLLRSGVKLNERDLPRKTAPDSVWVRPKPREAEAPVTLIAEGKPAPDFEMKTAAGKTVKLSDYKGKTVVLDFWATWCGPCKAALPHASELAAKYRDQGVVVLASCTNDDPAEFATFVEKAAVQYPELIFGCDMLGRSPERASRKLYGVSGIPQMFVINKDGVVAASVTGYMKGEVLFDAALAKAGIRVDEAILKQAEEDLRKREQPR
ncbi:MAG: hypothetical protein RL277_472 [Planctomycetota bacterium]|jgi:peroxiredoxin